MVCADSNNSFKTEEGLAVEATPMRSSLIGAVVFDVAAPDALEKRLALPEDGSIVDGCDFPNMLEALLLVVEVPKDSGFVCADCPKRPPVVAMGPELVLFCCED